MPPKKSKTNKRRATATNEGLSARRSRRRLIENLEQGAESSDTPSDVSSPESVQSLLSTSTAEVTEELPAISPTLDTPAVTAAGTPSTSNPSATPALPLSSEPAKTLAEGTTNEAGPQTSDLCDNYELQVNPKELDNRQRSCKNDGVNVELKKKIEELKSSQDELKSHILEVAGKQDEIHVIQTGMKDDVKEMGEDIGVMKQQFERLEGLLCYLLQENNVNRITGQVIILGGSYSHGDALNLNSVEEYNIFEKRSSMLPRLNHRRVQSASCVYNNDVLVVGGYDGEDGTDTIEVLKTNKPPLRWTIFDGKLPVKLSGHDVVVHQGKLYVIGGYDGNENIISNAIYEIALTPPYNAKLLTRMPEPRRYHRAELVNGKLFILGGTTINNDFLHSVVVYDLIKNEFKPCPSLPHRHFMSTVTWGDKIIVLGGVSENDEALNDVIMYDTETGRCNSLPSMIYRRSACSAVIMNDVIVVFGGHNAEQGFFNSVETFTIGGDRWKELPGMIEKRFEATAVVKPNN